MSTRDAERLAAGLDADDAARIKALGFRKFPRYNGMPPEWLIYASAEPGAAEIIQLGDKAERDIAAKRRILALYEEAPGYDLPEGVSDGRDPDERVRDEAVKDALAEVVAALAAVYAGAEETA